MSRAAPRALVVGAGGLGCPASLALAHAGVAAITLVDPDRVELSNLHRQLWHRTEDIGRSKAERAAEGLSAAFPRLAVESRAERVTPESSDTWLLAHDVVIDGTDDWRIKLALSDAAMRTGTPVVYGGVLRLGGQAMVVRRGGPCLRCLFEEPESLPSCAQAGVLGSVAGVVGALQGRLAMRALTQEKAPSEGLLHVLEAATLRHRTIAVPRAKDCRHD